MVFSLTHFSHFINIRFVLNKKLPSYILCIYKKTHVAFFILCNFTFRLTRVFKWCIWLGPRAQTSKYFWRVFSWRPGKWGFIKRQACRVCIPQTFLHVWSYCWCHKIPLYYVYQRTTNTTKISHKYVFLQHKAHTPQLHTQTHWEIFGAENSKPILSSNNRVDLNYS